MTVVTPTLGNVYSIPYNNSFLNLNYTFLYPANYTFDKLYVTFTLYDFNTNITANYATYPFGFVNFTNSNISLAWVVPNRPLGVGDYIFGCFNWIQANLSDQILANYSTCKLTRTSINSTVIPVVYIALDPPIVTNTTAMIKSYFPAGLPYDMVNIYSTLNGTTLPTSVSSVSNGTYSSINVYSFTNLTSNTIYNLCVYTNYSNSYISGTQTLNSQCQIIKTLAGGSSNVGVSSTNAPGGNSTNAPGGGSSNGVKINLIFITLLVIFILM
jgi:hypothetical protein